MQGVADLKIAAKLPPLSAAEPKAVLQPVSSAQPPDLGIFTAEKVCRKMHELTGFQTNRALDRQGNYQITLRDADGVLQATFLYEPKTERISLIDPNSGKKIFTYDVREAFREDALPATRAARRASKV